MNLAKKTNDWVNQKLITRKQQESILTHESRVRVPYVAAALMWLGTLCGVLGVISFITAHWDTIPHAVKMAGVAMVLVASLAVAVWGFRREKHLITEVALFLAFLTVGGGIGLLAQIFNLPLHNEKGLLLWAVLSLGIVLVSRRGMLSWLWMPLFLGGVLGFMKLELLLLFFEQAPVFATAVLGGILLAVVYFASLFGAHFMQNVYRWGLALFFGVLLLGDIQSTEEVAGFLLSTLLLGLLAAFAVMKNKLMLFHVICVFFGARLIVFYFQVFSSLTGTSLGLLLSGLVLFLAGGVWQATHRERIR